MPDYLTSLCNVTLYYGVWIPSCVCLHKWSFCKLSCKILHHKHLAKNLGFCCICCNPRMYFIFTRELWEEWAVSFCYLWSSLSQNLWRVMHNVSKNWLNFKNFVSLLHCYISCLTNLWRHELESNTGVHLTTTQRTCSKNFLQLITDINLGDFYWSCLKKPNK